MILLCRCQRTVALVFTEIRAVGKRRFAIGRVKPSPLKCTCQLLGDQIDQKFHACHLYPVIIFYIITDAAAVVQRKKKSRAATKHRLEHSKICAAPCREKPWGDSSAVAFGG